MAPIGIFDSGIGGLSIYLQCKKLLPGESFIYVDDGAHAPYGDKTEEFVRLRAETITRGLVRAGVRAVVVACNTATTVAIAHIRRLFDIPIIGTEPAVFPALKDTKGKVLVLATPLTCRVLGNRYADEKRLVFSPQSGLADEIERAKTATELLSVAKRVTYGDYEGVVLGCTHYSYLAPFIEKKVYDGAEGVARRLADVLGKSTVKQ